MEILHAVEDLIKIIRAHPLYDHLETVSEEEVTKLKKHYNHFMYQVKLAVAIFSRPIHAARLPSRSPYVLNCKKENKPFTLCIYRSRCASKWGATLLVLTGPPLVS